MFFNTFCNLFFICLVLYKINTQMAAPTIAEIKAMTFDYLTGADLLRFCPYQVLAKQYEVDSDSLQSGCNMAYKEAIGRMGSRYDVTTELNKTGTARDDLFIKIVALLAIRNIAGNQAGLPENMMKNFDWLENTITNIRNGQAALAGMDISPAAKISNTTLIPSSFTTLG